MTFGLFELNTGFIDIWTVVHILAGAFIGYILVSKPRPRWGFLAVGILLVLLGWELFEVAQPNGGFGGQENGLNLVSDLIFGLLGGFVGMWLGSKSTA